MGKSSIVLYFDLVSPFAYLALHVLRASSVFKDVDITFVPVFLGGIIKATGGVPPINIKNKAQWVGKERLRWAKLFDVPMAKQMPPGFPANTLQAQRAMTAVSLVQPEKLGDIVATLYNLSFAEGKEIHKVENLWPVFAQTLGDEAAKRIMDKASQVCVDTSSILIIYKASSDEVKQRLSANTDEALASGSFGLPWYIVTNQKGEKEHFWGFDHIGQVTDHLGLERPKPAKANEGGWRAML